MRIVIKTMNTNEERQKCNRCKMNLTLDKFNKKRDDTYMKQCIECNLKKVEYSKKNKCEHNRRRTTCKDCGGSELCEHNKRKYTCKDCGGSGVCEHNRQKSSCKDCRGSSFCEHNRQQSRCKDCGGSSICEHSRVKSKCKDCGGSEFCEHNKRKYTCKDCGGSGICEHNKIRTTCKDCGGSSICEHDKQRSKCRLCSKDIQKLTIQQMLYSSKNSDKKYNRYDSVNFIDKCFVKNLIEDYPTCYYEDCKVELQYREYNDTLGTLKRLNSDIGHIKSNCVICCLKCNHLDYTLWNTRISS